MLILHSHNSSVGFLEGHLADQVRVIVLDRGKSRLVAAQEGRVDGQLGDVELMLSGLMAQAGRAAPAFATS